MLPFLTSLFTNVLLSSTTTQHYYRVPKPSSIDFLWLHFKSTVLFEEEVRRGDWKENMPEKRGLWEYKESPVYLQVIKEWMSFCSSVLLVVQTTKELLKGIYHCCCWAFRSAINSLLLNRWLLSQQECPSITTDCCWRLLVSPLIKETSLRETLFSLNSSMNNWPACVKYR